MKRSTLVLGAALLWMACSDSTGPGQSGVSLSFTTRSTAAAPAPGFLASAMGDPLTDGQNELIIDRVEIVLREIELKRVDVADCDDVTGNDDSCEEFEAGPLLVDLPFDGSVETLVTVDIPPGTYDEIEFEIHKVSSDDPEDANFRTQHPDMVGKSLRVTGTYNGEAFTYETDLDVEQEHDLVQPLEVTGSETPTNVTVLLDVAVWFVDGSGNLVDPRSANKGGVNEGLVKENIKQSVEAFEDHDRDGHDDS